MLKRKYIFNGDERYYIDRLSDWGSILGKDKEFPVSAPLSQVCPASSQWVPGHKEAMIWPLPGTQVKNVWSFIPISRTTSWHGCRSTVIATPSGLHRRKYIHRNTVAQSVVTQIVERGCVSEYRGIWFHCSQKMRDLTLANRNVLSYRQVN
jgi:hypothetical protein